jgi:hypothetical protein
MTFTLAWDELDDLAVDETALDLPAARLDELLADRPVQQGGLDDWHRDGGSVAIAGRYLESVLTFR